MLNLTSWVSSNQELRITIHLQPKEPLQDQMPARNIPGFYYDESKKKYFKILANHVAPQGSKYSQAAISKYSEEEAIHKRRNAHEKRTIEQRIQRSKALNHSLCGGFGLGRETGVVEGGAPVLEAWAQRLEISRLLENKDSDCLLFDYDEASDLYIVAHAVGSNAAGQSDIIR